MLIMKYIVLTTTNIITNVLCVCVAGGERHGSDAPFRKWCGFVGELRSLLPVSLPELALTATVSLTTRKKTLKLLGQQKCLEVVRSPDRSNIRLAVKKVSSDATNTFSWLVNELIVKGPQTARTVIYCKSISNCSMLFHDVFLASHGQRSVHPPGASNVSSNRVVDMFHSMTSDSVKNHIIQTLRDPQPVLRVVLATSALGMGVDFKNVQHVVQKTLNHTCKHLGEQGEMALCPILSFFTMESS